MSEASFDKHFHIEDLAVAKRFLEDLNNPQKVRYTKRNLDVEDKNGVKLLQLKLETLPAKKA